MSGTCFLSLKVMLGIFIHVVMQVLSLNFQFCVISCETNYLRARQLLAIIFSYYSIQATSPCPFPRFDHPLLTPIIQWTSSSVQKCSSDQQWTNVDCTHLFPSSLSQDSASPERYPCCLVIQILCGEKRPKQVTGRNNELIVAF